MKIENLAYQLYCHDIDKNSDMYTQHYFYENIKTNELCESYYNKALKLIRNKKMNIINNISKK